MSDVINDGKTRVAWVTNISSISAPTVAELEAGEDFTLRVTPDGLNVPAETADVDNSSLASTFTTNRAGRRSFSPEVTFKRGDNPTDDLPWTMLTYQTMGYLVVRRVLPYTTAWAAGQEVEIYPVECGERNTIPPAPNEVAKFTSMMKLREEPDTSAVVAA
ncbi:phage tail tube protein [Streptomyces sp. NPDC054802]